MNIAMKAVSTALVSVVFLVSSLPTQAMPVPYASAGITTKVEQVQWRDRRGWYHGQRGYRGYRPGYRRHSDGFWYPLAAFGAGALIGGAIANQPRATSGLNSRHVNWCANRYQSYRASDNTYAPRAGVRAECTSPYY